MHDTDPICPTCQIESTEKWATTRDVEYFSLPDDFTFYNCAQCGVIFIHPMPVEHLDDLYPPHYYSFTNTLESPVYALKQWLDKRFFKRLLKRLPGTELRVLDIGGGKGWQLDLIRSIDPRVVLTQEVDIDSNAAIEARANGHEYFCGPIEAFESEEKFDFILMLNLIEHVENPLAILQKTRALLSPTGIIAVKTPNYDSLDARLFRHRNWSGYHCPRHWVLFTKESFKFTAEKAGLEFAEFRYTQGAYFWAGSILNWLAARKLIRVDKDRPMLTHPLCTPLLCLFGATELLRQPFAKTSQMFVILSRSNHSEKS